MNQVWQPVKVKNDQHARFDQAGTVQAIDPAHPDEVGVKFDLDGQIQVVKVADLQAL